MLLMTGGTGTRFHDIGFMERVMGVTGFALFVYRPEVDFASKAIAYDLFGFCECRCAAGPERLVMALATIGGKAGMGLGNLSGVEESFPTTDLKKNDSRDSGENRNQTGPEPGSAPGMQ